MTAEPVEQSEIAALLQELQGNPRDRVLALQALSRSPLPDTKLLAACEKLLGDRTMALISIPYSFGEVRWCAADAVAAVRHALCISEPVVIEDIFAPVSTAHVVELAKAAGLEPGSGVDGMIETLEELAKLDRLPRRRIARTPTFATSTSPQKL